jgi:hypothetical protein
MSLGPDVAGACYAARLPFADDAGDGSSADGSICAASASAYGGGPFTGRSAFGIPAAARCCVAFAFAAFAMCGRSAGVSAAKSTGASACASRSVSRSGSLRSSAGLAFARAVRAGACHLRGPARARPTRAASPGFRAGSARASWAAAASLKASRAGVEGFCSNTSFWGYASESSAVALTLGVDGRRAIRGKPSMGNGICGHISADAPGDVALGYGHDVSVCPVVAAAAVGVRRSTARNK